MYRREHRGAAICLAACIALFGITAAETAAQETVRVYAAGGPSPAIEEAAVAFQQRFGAQVEVTYESGARPQLAGADIDLILDEDEFMLPELETTGALALTAGSLRPLYIRPSVIVVRPDNPKNIQDLPDLLAPGTRILLTHSAGRAGAWKEMVTKLGDMPTFSSFYNNISHVAKDGSEAMRVWKENSDIDAWVTWNIWHLPLRHQAKLITMDPDHAIYRQCSLALTHRGRERPMAAQFAQFLSSRQGAAVFESWSWQRPLPGVQQVRLHNHVCLLCCFDRHGSDRNVAADLSRLKALLEQYKALAIPAREIHIAAVLRDGNAHCVLKDQPYAAYVKNQSSNPHQSIVQDLMAMGVSLELSDRTLAEHGWSKDDVLAGVTIVSDDHARVEDLERHGYATFRF